MVRPGGALGGVAKPHEGNSVVPEDYSAHCGRERTRKAVRSCYHSLTIRDLAHRRRPTLEAQTVPRTLVTSIRAPTSSASPGYRPEERNESWPTAHLFTPPTGGPIAADVDRVKLAPM